MAASGPSLLQPFPELFVLFLVGFFAPTSALTFACLLSGAEPDGTREPASALHPSTSRSQGRQKPQR